MVDYLRMKKKELLALAKKAGIIGRSRMTKGELAGALEQFSLALEPPVIQVPGSPVPDRDPGPPPMARPETPELPFRLGETRLCLMPQGPRTAFAYWETAPGSLTGQLILAVRSLPDESEIVRIAVGGEAGSAYVNLGRSGLEIETVLGVEGADGFRELLRSNPVQLPWDSPDEVGDTLWMTRRRDFEEIFRLSGGGTWAFESDTEPFGRSYPGVPVSSWPGAPGKEKP